jgi:hypothetical protein
MRFRGERGGQLLAPTDAVPRQGEIESYNVFNILPVDRAITDGGASSDKPMQKGLRALFRRAFEAGAVSRRENGLQVSARFLDPLVGHPEHQMVFETLSVIVESLRKMPWKQRADKLHDTKDRAGKI